MKLVSVIEQGARRAALLDGEELFVSDVAELKSVIAQGLDIRKLPGRWRPLAQSVLDVPLRPGAVLGTGSNYRDHLDERIAASDGMNAPRRELEFFVKTGGTIAALADPMRLHPSIGLKIDQETELALVMGPGCKRGMSEQESLDHVFGYLVANDLTARDRQVRLLSDGSNFMVLGASKNFDGATRFSSYVVSADEVREVNNLRLTTYLNGELKQDNSTRNLINSFARIISFFSQMLTLDAGDVIITGTPGGTGWGQDAALGGKGYVPPGCTPSRYLQPGDEVRSVIEQLGEIVFRTE